MMQKLKEEITAAANRELTGQMSNSRYLHQNMRAWRLPMRN